MTVIPFPPLLLLVDYTSAQVRARDGKLYVARGSLPPARQAKRSGKRGCGGGGSHLPSASWPVVASRLQDKPSAAGSGGVGEQPPPAKRVVARSSEPLARRAERSAKRGWRRQPPSATQKSRRWTIQP
jgi:hypothetical protein